VRLWDLRTGTAAGLPTSSYYVTALVFAPDGRTLATSGSDVQLWDLTTRKATSLPGSGGMSRGIAFSPDGRRLAVAGLPGDLEWVGLWDIASRKLLATLQQDAVRPAAITGVAFAPDGRHVAAAAEDGRVSLWKV
jgi:hypothetical protein